jgi:hypothetical protein
VCVQDQRYTSWFDRDRDNRDDGTGGGENSAIDHVLVSQKLWDVISGVDIIHEAPAGVSGEALSDHWPILVTFGTPGQVAQAYVSGDVSGSIRGASNDAWIWRGCSALGVLFILMAAL